MTPTTIRLPPAEQDRLEALAQQHSRARSAVASAIIRAWLAAPGELDFTAPAREQRPYKPRPLSLPARVLSAMQSAPEADWPIRALFFEGVPEQLVRSAVSVLRRHGLLTNPRWGIYRLTENPL